MKCFMVEQTGRARYHSGFMSKDAEPRCTDGGLHAGRIYGEWMPETDKADFTLKPAYPPSIRCDKCGLMLTDDNASRFGGYGPEWRNPLTGETTEHPWTLGPGAMFFVRGPHCCFPHEPPCAEHLHVILPNGHTWDIDSRANNCTMPDDKVHHCWVREGVPPNVTAGKSGNTCAAGAGSIQAGNYHGFLRNGAFDLA